MYPGICADVPEWLRRTIRLRLEDVMREPVQVQTQFARLTPKGTQGPHQAHTDGLMSDFSAMLYLNRPEHCQGGTALVRHCQTGMNQDPATQEGVLIWQRDTNQYEAWEETFKCEMLTNRCFVFPSTWMHRAEPVDGFGTTAHDGRLVLVTFFNV